MLRTLSKLRPIFHNTIQRSPNPDDFFIELNDPHKTFSPGSTVDGSVVLVLAKPQKVTSIVCTIRGTILIRNTLVKTKAVKHILFEETVVLWGDDANSRKSIREISKDSNVITIVETDQNKDNCNNSIRSGKSSKSSKSNKSIKSNKSSSSGKTTKTTNSTKTTDNDVTNQSNSTSSTTLPINQSDLNTNNRPRSVTMSTISSSNSLDSSSPTFEPLPRGEHLFAFEFVLPKEGLFNSLEFERGAISYTITSTCHRSSPSPIVTAQKALSVICPIDISTLPPPKVSTLTVDVHKKRKGHGSIVVAVSLPRRGYLRGDSVPVKVNVQHIKHVKHLSGIITTLSRISIVSAEGTEAQSFRKDLSQTISPLYTDPATFKSTVTTNIRIPPDTFPTTKGHRDISFQYCIEVVLDLSGKRSIDFGSSGRDNNEGDLSKLGFIDTDKLKRARGVVNLWTEVIIGTHNGGENSDSNGNLNRKLKGKQPNNINIPPLNNNSNSSISPQTGNFSSSTIYNVLGYDEIAQSTPPASTSNLNNTAASEKETLRQMEEAILPSNPPIQFDNNNAPAYVTSSEYNSTPPPSLHHQPSAPPEHLVMASSIPTYEQDSGESSSSNQTQLPDKAELQRELLERHSSVPEDDYVPRYEPIESNENQPSAPSLPNELKPSTPPLTHYIHNQRPHYVTTQHHSNNSSNSSHSNNEHHSPIESSTSTPTEYSHSPLPVPSSPPISQSSLDEPSAPTLPVGFHQQERPSVLPSST